MFVYASKLIKATRCAALHDFATLTVERMSNNRQSAVTALLQHCYSTVKPLLQTAQTQQTHL
jgi:hypothetical protein